MVKKKYVYFFGNGGSDGSADDKNLLGGKGAYLAEMANIDIPIPAGFTVTTEVCTDYYDNDGKYPDGVKKQVEDNLKKLEKVNGTKFGDAENALLVSVRSGARASMPGMMDTVLNLGLNDTTVEGLAKKSGNPRFAYDCYRRFITMFGDVVLGIEYAAFEKILDAKKKELGVSQDTELDVEALKDLVSKYKIIIKKKANIDFPQDPMKQLWMAIDAVFDSWNNQRAITYRKIHKIPDDWGTAVSVQTMVYGNMGDTSGTGVAFTRDPATGEKRFFGEYLINAQGEDVVAGIRTPQPIATLKSAMPESYAQLETIYKNLEAHFKDMQDIEFTIQEGQLYMLQARTGKRTANAAINIAVDMVDEGLIDTETAVLRIEPAQLDQLLHPMIDPSVKIDVVAKGLAASPGAAVGRVVFDAETAEKWVSDGEKVILVRSETSPEDIGGMHVAEGILTVRGGMTSHAAVVARGMGTCCIAGCGQISINEEGQYFTVNGCTVNKGDHITLNGSTGEVTLGQVKLITPELSGNLDIVLEWADDVRKLAVRANADTPYDAKIAR
ncbi:MAG: pyruvate, phosphate dikinase, partial [Methanosarcinales archaeon]|nr:pyruvate, phosphate dikinase [Methanosarcinales archaeon]